MIQILIADDHAMLLDSVADQIQAHDDLQVVGRVGTADEAAALARQTRPDVILMDIDMPGRSSFDVTKEIKQQLPKTHIIYLSAFHTDRYIEDAIQSGCSGYLVKGEPVKTVIHAIREVVKNGSYYSEAVSERLVVDPLKGLTLDSSGNTRLSQLSTREIEVLRYVAEGLTKKQIAERVHRSVSTIDKHVENIMRKLDIHDRVELARFAIREGLTQA